MSELSDDWAFIEANDVRVTVFTNSSSVCSVRLVHAPTGLSVVCNGKGQITTRHEAVEMMRQLLSQSPPPAPPADGYLIVSTSTGNATWA